MFGRSLYGALMVAAGAILAERSGAAASAIITLTPVSDTSIVSSGVNPQGDQTILSGTRGQNAGGAMDRGLLRFDLGSIPAGATVQSVVVRLTVVMTPQVPVESNFGLYRALKRWDESADWINAQAGMAWGTAGGQEGVDYVADASVTEPIGSTGEYDYGPSDALTGEINGWLTDPASNFGWFLISDLEGAFNSARHFGSSESASPPELEVTYSLVQTNQPTLKNPLAQPNHFLFSFDPSPGRAYRVEARTNLATGAWTTVTNLPAATSTNSIVVTNALGAPSKFFRLLVQ